MRANVLLCTALVLAGSAGAGMVTTDTSRGCSWLNPQACDSTVTTPVLGLMFLHMRKSGGTHILHFLSEWMRARGCFDGMAKKSDMEGIENINKGQIFHKKKITAEIIYREGHSTCHYLDVYHNEYFCLSGDMVAQFPVWAEKTGTNFKLLTVLRDPIERIGSQFLHTPECFGRRHVLDTVWRECGTKKWLGHCKNDEKRGLPRSALCSCVYNATGLAYSNLRTNESVWFDWFQNSQKGFKEQYIDNYYVKRLASVPIVAGKPRHHNLIESDKCLRSPQVCAWPVDFYLLQKLSSFHQCIERPAAARYSDQAALEIAKTLLQDHFHLLILEFFNEKDSIKRVFSEILGEKSVSDIIDRGEWSRDQKVSRVGQLKQLSNITSAPAAVEALTAAIGISTNVSSSMRYPQPWHSDHSKSSRDKLEIGNYQRLMPASVVRYVMENNREDYELYHFERQIYIQRFSTDGSIS